MMELVLIKHLVLTRPSVTNLLGTISLNPHTKLMANNMAFKIFLFILFIFSCVGSSLLCAGFL